ncbi:hypothetical protein CRG98_028640 [Punica granatum]|uniref:Late embryogenesis abundant protein LEA-2 subgroup domain-containing protein n=1 Tax=Punica granatum TaxID=22663 RepID=A0A2I0J4S1_PUNGR|nr:hypothetical protein CRG98_028640 [Punica granatum]
MAKDTESFQSQEEKRQKRMKLAAYIGAFAVFQVIVILVFALVVMKVKTPKFRIGNGIEIQSLTAGTQSSPSFDMSFIAPIRIKNTNFGPYKYDATTVAIPKSKANFKSTKKVDVIVSVNSDALTSTSGLGSELNSGLLTLNSQGRMNGKVELMLIFKKKKSTNMNCTMAINVSTKAVQSVSCE